MKRSFCISMCLLVFEFGISHAQSGIVHDPIQTTIQSTEAGQTLTEMIAILETVMGESEMITKLKDFEERNFGEGSWGDILNQTLNEMGYLEDMVRSFNSIIEVTTMYGELLQRSDMSSGAISAMAQQIHIMVKNAMDMIEHYKTLIPKKTKTLEQKEREIKVIRDSLNSLQLYAYNSAIQQLEIHRAALELKQMDDFLIEATDSQSYISFREKYGSISQQKYNILNLVKLLLGLLGLGCIIWSWITMVRGSASGEETSQMGFLRTGIALFGSSLIITVIESVLNATGVL